jgi:ADP-heptose:LPS heptosyltransferase
VSLKKVLLIRLDKIGDLICTLPADQVLDENVYDVTWVVQKGLGSIVDLGVKHRNYIELDKNNIKQAREKLNSLIKVLKPDIAVSFQCPWWVNFELFKAGVPVRSGVKSQWHSFLFLNKAIRQKRSLAEKHELEYNLELLYKTLDITADQALNGTTVLNTIALLNGASILRVHDAKEAREAVTLVNAYSMA